MQPKAVTLKVNGRVHPVALAPIAALMTPCSDSIGKNSASNSPSWYHSASVSIISVCGVMGKLGMNSVLQSLAAYAAASFPSMSSLISLIIELNHVFLDFKPFLL